MNFFTSNSFEIWVFTKRICKNNSSWISLILKLVSFGCLIQNKPFVGHGMLRWIGNLLVLQINKVLHFQLKEKFMMDIIMQIIIALNQLNVLLSFLCFLRAHISISHTSILQVSLKSDTSLYKSLTRLLKVSYKSLTGLLEVT